MIDVNVMHVGMMTMMFKDKLIERQAKSQGQYRSAIINVSSTIGYFEGCAGAAIYNATKAYVNYFTVAAAYEY